MSKTKYLKIISVIIYICMTIVLGSNILVPSKDVYASDMMKITIEDSMLSKAPGYNYSSAVKGVSPSKVTFTEDDLKKAKVIWKTLKENTDLNDIQIASTIGNIYQESLFKNDVVNSLGAVGICQWLGSRRTELQSFASGKGKSEKDLHTQVEFLVKETKGPYKDLYYSKMKKTKTLADATAVFMIWYETPGVHEAMFNRRLGASKEAYEKIAGKDLGGVKTVSKEEKPSAKTGGEGYTGALDFNPFIDGKPSQNTTGIDYKNKDIGASEGYIFASFFSKLIFVIMIVALVLTATYIISIAILILGIALDSNLISDNKLLRKVGGEEFTDTLRAYGITGSIKQIAIRFGVPVIILNLVILGVVGQVQNIIVTKIVDIVELLF